MQGKAISYIRFSTPEQAKGDSYRRQYEATKKYCQKNGLELDGTFYDNGVSAYKGAQRKGELGRILEMIKEGEIPRGSILIVESLDRLSREKVSAQMISFLELLNNGISIVTLADGVTHSAENSDQAPVTLMMALAVMMRANEESETKSKRLASAWENKRQKIHLKPLTSVMPNWLKLVGEKPILMEERAQVVREIFTLALEGMGRRSIANTLNKRGEEIWGGKRSKSGIWSDSYIAKILSNKAVIGEFQPCKKIDGKRVPVGEPITDYYPRIIEDKVFYAVQSEKRKRKNKGGRSIDKANNYFSGICYCGNCGAKMNYLNKGNGWKYMSCQKRKLGCDSKMARYSELENFVVTHLLNDRWGAKTEQKHIDVSAKEEKLRSIKKQIENVTLAISEMGPSVALKERLSGLEKLSVSQKKEIEYALSKNAEGKMTMDDVVFFTDLHKNMNGVNDVNYRRKVKKMVLSKIESIWIGQGYCIKLYDGRHYIGDQVQSGFYDIWQLNSKIKRKVIQYSMINIKNKGYAMEPSLITLKKGVDLLEPFGMSSEVDTDASNTIIQERYKSEQDDFAALTPRVHFSDGLASWGKIEGLRDGLESAQLRAKSKGIN